MFTQIAPLRCATSASPKCLRMLLIKGIEKTVTKGRFFDSQTIERQIQNALGVRPSALRPLRLEEGEFIFGHCE